MCICGGAIIIPIIASRDKREPPVNLWSSWYFASGMEISHGLLEHTHWTREDLGSGV